MFGLSSRGHKIFGLFLYENVSPNFFINRQSGHTDGYALNEDATKKIYRGRGSGNQVVRVLAFYFDDPSLNLAEA